jgi:galactose mutarotase-like enzyme
LWRYNLAVETFKITEEKTGANLLIDVAHGLNALEFNVPCKNTTYNLLYKKGAPLLFPFANRLLLNENGEFEWTSFSGKIWKVQVLNDDLVANNLVEDSHYMKSAQHGFVKHLPFTVKGNGTDFVTAELKFSEFSMLPEFYNGLELEITYKLKDSVWITTAIVHNHSEHAIPHGFCIHYWFNTQIATGTKRDDCIVRLPASQRWLSENKFPTGEIVSVEDPYDFRNGRQLGVGQYYDDVFLRDFTLGTDQSIIEFTDEAVRIVVEASPAFKNLVFYVPEDQPATLCIEPQTCSVDMFNMAARKIDGANMFIQSPHQMMVFESKVWFEDLS